MNVDERGQENKITPIETTLHTHRLSCEKFATWSAGAAKKTQIVVERERVLIDGLYTPQVRTVSPSRVFKKSEWNWSWHAWKFLRKYHPRRCINTRSMNSNIRLHVKHSTYLFHIYVYMSAENSDGDEDLRAFDLSLYVFFTWCTGFEGS